MHKAWQANKRGAGHELCRTKTSNYAQSVRSVLHPPRTHASRRVRHSIVGSQEVRHGNEKLQLPSSIFRRSMHSLPVSNHSSAMKQILMTLARRIFPLFSRYQRRRRFALKVESLPSPSSQRTNALLDQYGLYGTLCFAGVTAFRLETRSDRPR